VPVAGQQRTLSTHTEGARKAMSENQFHQLPAPATVNSTTRAQSTSFWANRQVARKGD
jgi:hypothetical protein